MIFTVFRIGLLRLRNNPLELLLMFGVPVVFFSIFALIFSRGVGTGKTAAVPVVFVDEDLSDTTAELIHRLVGQAGIQNIAETADEDAASLLTEQKALQRIRSGDATLGIVFRSGFGQDLMLQHPQKVEILADSSDQVATQVVSALVQQALAAERVRMASTRELASPPRPAASQLPRNAPNDSPGMNSTTDGRSLFSDRSSPLPTPVEYSASPVDVADPFVGESSRVRQDADRSLNSQPENAVEVIDVLASDIVNPKISMYAAGIAVMFVLFSASGAGGTLLEEQEAGTLERLLSSRLTVTQLLAGKWLFICSCASVQLLVMFIWAQLLFQVDLVGHLAGFTVMAISTSASAASLALLLATVCRSRSQLNGVSVILILTMSALGGSMVPRYIMSDEMQTYGLLTFNAWALDGFDKVFWRNLPIDSLQPQVTVLLCAAVGLGFAARIFAQRWES